jgi:imidazolonepropionase
MIKTYLHLNEVLTLESVHKKDGRKILPSDMDIIEDGAVVFSKKEILWTGKTSDLPKRFLNTLTYNLHGHCLTPALVDSHTHLVFGGDRSQDYARRLNGETYQQIATRGGGIQFTVNQTKLDSNENLFHRAVSKIDQIYHQGVRALEIKSGYGLDFESEVRILEVIKLLKDHFSSKIKIFSTFMGAHAVPPGQSSDRFLISEVLPVIKKHSKLIDFADIFFEEGYFSKSDVLKLSEVCKEYEIPLRIHADEFKDSEGASLAHNLKALSADHLLGISSKGIHDLSKSKTVATLLPGTALFLGKPMAPARAMLDAGVKVAIATDYNPGSCHFSHLLQIASISAPTLKLNQAELWASITHNSAHALGLQNWGAITAGMQPAFSLFKAHSISEITYRWGENLATLEP